MGRTDVQSDLAMMFTHLKNLVVLLHKSFGNCHEIRIVGERGVK
jgi:hypothetical protein